MESGNTVPTMPVCLRILLCIYKKNAELSIEKWQVNTTDARKESACFDFFAAFMEKQKTEVWFSTSAEQAVTIILPNQITNQYGVTTIPSLKATDRFCWKGDDWKSTGYSIFMQV